MDVTALRAQIPALAEQIWMNTGWSGPSPIQVVEALKNRIDMEAMNPPASMRVIESAREIRGEALQAVGRLMNADPEELVLTRNTTEGLNMVLSGLDWQPGDEIVTCSLEHPSVPATADLRLAAVDTLATTMKPWLIRTPRLVPGTHHSPPPRPARGCREVVDGGIEGTAENRVLGRRKQPPRTRPAPRREPAEPQRRARYFFVVSHHWLRVASTESGPGRKGNVAVVVQLQGQFQRDQLPAYRVNRQLKLFKHHNTEKRRCVFIAKDDFGRHGEPIEPHSCLTSFVFNYAAIGKPETRSACRHNTQIPQHGRRYECVRGTCVHHSFNLSRLRPVEVGNLNGYVYSSHADTITRLQNNVR